MLSFSILIPHLYICKFSAFFFYDMDMKSFLLKAYSYKPSSILTMLFWLHLHCWSWEITSKGYFMNILITYFSRKWYSLVQEKMIDLAIGNTEVAANKIKALIGDDLFQIETLHTCIMESIQEWYEQASTVGHCRWLWCNLYWLSKLMGENADTNMDVP